uniref:PRKR-interacting protein 1 n=1 Tax=Ditylenchus dipsaci TaxID=166011 RepID=A0A915DF33_9BILA
MPREDREAEEERRARTAYDLIRLRLGRLQKNIDKPAPVPARHEEWKPKPPPDFIRNVVGSSAAANSAEFHIFRNNRKKEMERLEYIEKQGAQKDLDEEFETRNEKRRQAEEARTAKKRQKRQRRKEKLKNVKKTKKGAGDQPSESSSSEEDSDKQEDKNENDDNKK